jgi:hypothetical protein
MSFASDVKAKTVTATGDMVNGRTRIQGIYYTCTGTAAAITLKTGGSSGTLVMEVKTPAAPGCLRHHHPGRRHFGHGRRACHVVLG